MYDVIPGARAEAIGKVKLAGTHSCPNHFLALDEVDSLSQIQELSFDETRYATATSTI